MNRFQQKCRQLLSGQSIILVLAAVLLFALCVVPFIELFLKIIFSGVDGEFSLEPYRHAFARHSALIAVGNTLVLSTLVTLLSLILAVPLAWLLSRTDLLGAKRWRSWLSIPFAIPPFIGAIAWIFLANPSTGLLNKIFGGSFFNIYSFSGLVFVESSFLYAFVLMTALSSFDRIDSSLEEAARLSGAPPWRVFCDVSLPLLRPALSGAALLVFLATAASFGVPALIGSPARIYLMTTQIYMFQKMGSISGLLRAGALSTCLMAVAFVVLTLVQYLTRKQSLQTVGGKTARPSLIELGKYRHFAFGGVTLFWIITFILPVLGIFVSSVSHVQGDLQWSNLTGQTWIRTLLQNEETGRAFLNSFILAGSAATGAVLLSILVGYIQVKTRLPGRGLLGSMASLPYATPGTVLAFAMILSFSGSFLGILPSLYNTLALIALAYLIKYLSFAMNTAKDAYAQIDDVLAEAARVSGANWTRTMLTIWLPLLAPALAAGWFLVFMPALSELTMTILLTGPGLETIGTTIYQLQEYSDAGGGGASVLSLVVVILVVTINLLVKWISRGRYGL